MNVQLIPIPRSTFEETVDVSGFPFVIGRADGCDLQLNNSWVSRYHCEIITAAGEIRVRDLASSNGTYVNEERVDGEHVLKNGDFLNVASVIYAVVIQSGEHKHAPLRQHDELVGCCST